MAGDVDDVVNATRDPVIAVLITTAAVACEVVILVVGEIGLFEPLMIAPDGAHLRGPTVFHAEHAFGGCVMDFLAGGWLKNNRLNAEEGEGRRAGFGRCRTGQRGQQVTTCFCLPPCVDNRNVSAADNLMIPIPSLWVDGFTNRAEDFEIAQVVLCDPFVPLPHKRADGGWGGVELVHFVLFADRPKTTRVRIGWHAFKHQCRRPVGERAIDDVAVARDPANIRSTPEDVAVMIIKRVLMRHGGVDDVTARRMHNAFGHAG